MSELTDYPLEAIFPVTIPGEWGFDPIGSYNALVIRGADFTKDGKLKKDMGVPRQIPCAKLQIKAVRWGDVLIEKSGGSPDQPVGRVVFFDTADERDVYVHSNFLHLLRVAEGFDNRFSYYLLDLLYFSGRVLRYQQQTTGIINLKLDAYLKERVRVPSEANQKKIALILQTIDQAIEKTAALIAKYQQIKAGLMHDLLTRGIGSDGQPRPPREQAPELYQETPIGWIPKDWGYDRLESLLAPVPNNLRSGPFGSSLLKSELVESGIPFLGIDNIQVENFVDAFRRHVSEKKFLALGKYAVRPRDVVITIMGTVGRSAVIPDGIGRALSSKHLWTMTFNPEIVVPELVCWQLNYASWVQSWFRKETQGGIMDAIQSRTLRTVVLPVIPMEEQKEIFRRYLTMNHAISSEEKKLSKLRKEQTGLMHDLLTGKVSVQVEPEDIPEPAHV